MRTAPGKQEPQHHPVRMSDSVSAPGRRAVFSPWTEDSFKVTEGSLVWLWALWALLLQRLRWGKGVQV